MTTYDTKTLERLQRTTEGALQPLLVLKTRGGMA